MWNVGSIYEGVDAWKKLMNVVLALATTEMVGSTKKYSHRPAKKLQHNIVVGD